MIEISVSMPPQSFQNYLKYSNNPSWTDLGKLSNKSTKDDLKNALVEESYFLCGYCGKRVEKDRGTQIEHIYPKANNLGYSHLQLEYQNLIAGCISSGKKGHCGQFKGDKVIHVHPRVKRVDKRFLVKENGEIEGITPRAQRAVIVLNLNQADLVEERKDAISGRSSEYTQLLELLNLGYVKLFHEKCMEFLEDIERPSLSSDGNKRKEYAPALYIHYREKVLMDLKNFS